MQRALSIVTILAGVCICGIGGGGQDDRQLVESLRADIRSLQKDNESLRAENGSLQKQTMELKEKIRKLEEESSILRDEAKSKADGNNAESPVKEAAPPIDWFAVGTKWVGTGKGSRGGPMGRSTFPIEGVIIDRNDSGFALRTTTTGNQRIWRFQKDGDKVKLSGLELEKGNGPNAPVGATRVDYSEVRIAEIEGVKNLQMTVRFRANKTGEVVENDYQLEWRKTK